MSVFDSIENKTPNRKKSYPKNNEINPLIWADMTLDERSTYYIAEAYMKFAKSRGDFRKHIPSARVKTITDERPADKIRNHKNWKYFQKVWERFENDQAFDADIYLESIARHLPKAQMIFPAQLATKKNIKDYLEYRQSLKLTSHADTTKQIMEDVMQTYKLISRKIGTTKITREQLYDFFNTTKDNNIISEGLLFCIQEMISPYYYSVSRSFLTAYKNSDKEIQEEIKPLDRLKDMSLLVKSNDRVYSFVKKVFGEDII